MGGCYTTIHVLYCVEEAIHSPGRRLVVTFFGCTTLIIKRRDYYGFSLLSFLSSFFSLLKLLLCVTEKKLIPSHNTQVVWYGGFRPSYSFYSQTKLRYFFPSSAKLFKENKCTLLKRFSKLSIPPPSGSRQSYVVP